jgi:hypothetical protein
MTFTTEEQILCEAFNARLETPTDGCAHALFPEITGSDVAMSLIDQTMDSIVENYQKAGAMVAAGVLDNADALGRVAETIDHALVIAVAFGYALGQASAADALAVDVPDDIAALFSEPEDNGPEAA